MNEQTASLQPLSNDQQRHMAAKPVSCIECEDQEAAMLCLTCNEPFCGPCFNQQHHRGKRAQHATQPINNTVMPAPSGQVIGLAADPSTIASLPELEGEPVAARAEVPGESTVDDDEQQTPQQQASVSEGPSLLDEDASYAEGSEKGGIKGAITSGFNKVYSLTSSALQAVNPMTYLVSNHCHDNGELKLTYHYTWAVTIELVRRR